MLNKVLNSAASKVISSKFHAIWQSAINFGRVYIYNRPFPPYLQWLIARAVINVLKDRYYTQTTLLSYIRMEPICIQGAKKHRTKISSKSDMIL